MNAIVQHQVSDMERMARAFVASKLFGVTSPDQALALCLIAQAEGRHPATAAQDYNIIQGRPAKKADAMLRDFLAGGGKVEWHTLTDAKADATFSHPAGGSARIDWDMKRAQAAQLGGKDMWKKFPRQMLRSRVISEGVRTVYPMATSGMYEPGEVADFAPDPKPQEAPTAAIAEMRDVTPPRKGSAISDDPRVPIDPDLALAALNAKYPKGRTVNPMSANQAKKDGRGERAAKLANEIADLTEVTECLAWKMIHIDEVGTWPKPWQEELWGRWDIHIEGLRELAAKVNTVETEVEPDDTEAEVMFPEAGDDRVAGYARELAAAE